jgi:hypothetical protein
VKLDEPLTFPAAAQEIGWKADHKGDYRAAGRRLLRLALRREAESQKRFIIRDSSGRPVKVTLGALSRFLPECLPGRVDTLAASLRPVLEGVEQRVQEIVDERIQITVEPELQRLFNRDEELALQLKSTMAAVDALSAALLKRRAG